MPRQDIHIDEVYISIDNESDNAALSKEEITRSTTNGELLDMIEDAVHNVPAKEEAPEPETDPEPEAEPDSEEEEERPARRRK